MDEPVTVEIDNSSWTVQTRSGGIDDGLGEPLAEVHVIIREWTRGGAEVRVGLERTGARSQREVLEFAIRELVNARELLR